MDKATPVPRDRAYELADSAIGLFLEYRDQHGYDEQPARAAAVAEVMEGEAARAEVYGPADDEEDTSLCPDECDHLHLPADGAEPDRAAEFERARREEVTPPAQT